MRRSSVASNSRYSGLSDHSDVTWGLKLEPGETKVITYDFSFYMR